MSHGFVHSVKVPRLYKTVANIVRRVCEEGASLKSLIYEQKHTNISGIYALSASTLQFNRQLDELFRRTQILTKEPRLDPWLAKVLITELLWGKQHLSGSSKPVQTVLAYADKLQEESKSLGNTERSSAPKIAQKRPRYIRINTLLISVDETISLFQEEGWKLLPRSTTYSSYLQSLSQLLEPYFLQDFHIPEVLAFPPSTCFLEHAGYNNNKLILQDKASCLPAHLLDPAKGSAVLDFCASPGMKATHLAAKLQNNGKIYAVEIDNKRYETLCNQIKKTHSSCVEPLNQDALTLDLKRYQSVEYILVDPSCSGSGIIGRPQFIGVDNEPDLKRLQNLQSFQVYLLRHALFNFPTVKRVVYSTCSLHPEENEQVIDEVLADIGDAYRLMPIKDLLKDNWINFSSQEYKCGDRCLYSRPEIDFCTGFFMAVFERNFEVPLPECRRKGGNIKPLKNIDTSMELSNSVENVSRKRKKRGKKKKNKNTPMDDGQVTKTPENVIEFEIPKVENGKTDEVCSESNFNTDEVILDRPKNDWESLKDSETKKSRKKKKKKRGNVIEDNVEMTEIYDIEKKRNETRELVLIKSLKRRKEEKDKEVAEIQNNAKVEEKGEEILIELSKHKNEEKKRKKEAVEIDNDVQRDEENEKIAIKSPKKKKRKVIEINTIKGVDEDKLPLN